MAVFFIFSMLLGAALQITNAFGDTYIQNYRNQHHLLDAETPEEERDEQDAERLGHLRERQQDHRVLHDGRIGILRHRPEVLNIGIAESVGYLQSGAEQHREDEEDGQENVRINMYDAGIYYQNDRFHIEAEYLYKMYGHEAMSGIIIYNQSFCRFIHLTITMIGHHIIANQERDMYDAGIYYQNDRFHIEAEYLYKMYGHEAFKDVHAGHNHL